MCILKELLAPLLFFLTLTVFSIVFMFQQVLINASAVTIKEVVKNGGSLVKDEPPKSGKGAPSKDKKDDKNPKKEERVCQIFI